MMVGPTAVGKTALAIELSQKLGGEIISADSRLFYRGMDIGTAKPSREEMEQIAHHLIDIAEPDETVSLAVFQQKAQAAIVDIHARGKLPFLVGGTGQYIRAVTEGWIPPAAPPDERLRRILEMLREERGGAWLHEKLHAMDAEAAEKIDARNIRRTIRALEVILLTGRKFSAQRAQNVSPYQLIPIGLKRPREELYRRIDERIDLMIARGLMDEVRRLISPPNCFSPNLPSMSAIGYREIARVVGGEWTIEQAVAEMRRQTRIFVRRQANWFKESDPGICWFHPDQKAEIESYLRRTLIAL